MESYLDISLVLRNGMLTWPGDEEVRVERTLDMDHGDPYNLSRIRLGLHAGTHFDAPLHYLTGGADIAFMPPEVGIGPARVVEVANHREIAAADLETLSPRQGERLLLKTLNSRRPWWKEPFNPHYAHLTVDAARYLSERGIRLLGIDYLSVGPHGEGSGEVHRLLLEAGIWILEGLDLTRVEPGDYELLCLPLKVANGDGSPARAMLKALP